MFGLFALSIALAHPSISPSIATSFIKTDPVMAVKLLNPLPTAEEMVNDYVETISEAQKLATQAGWQVKIATFQGIKHQDTRVGQNDIRSDTGDPNVWATTLTISFWEDGRQFDQIEVIFSFARTGKTWRLVQLLPIRADTVGSFFKTGNYQTAPLLLGRCR